MVGVAGGIGERSGIDPAIVRVGLVVLCLAGGLGLAIYLAAWRLSGPPSLQPQQRLPTTTTELRHVAAVASMVSGVLLAARSAGLWLGDAVVWPSALAAFGATVIWVRSDRSASNAPRNPLDAVLTGQASARLLIGSLFVLSAMALVLTGDEWLVQGIAFPVVVTVAGLTLVFGPWLHRLAQQLSDERRERIRSEERSELAAHLHDSVLQTLALIQRSDDVREMSSLARVQERELRAWLFGVRPPGEETLGSAIESMAARVESQHHVRVEAVVVGDAPVDGRVSALVDAAAEATVNAAKHSGAESISLFVEVQEHSITAYVRDTGRGFDPRVVGQSPGGIAESMRARIVRHAGTLEISSAPGEGTEVKLELSR